MTRRWSFRKWHHAFGKARSSRRTAHRPAALGRLYRPGLELLEDRLGPASFTWNNLAGGDWDTVSNWNVNGAQATTLPGAGDDVVINALNAGASITHAQDTQDAVNSIIAAASITISAGTLSAAGTLTLSSGTLTIGPSCTVSAFDYTQTAAAALTIDIAGHSSAGQYGALQVAQTATLDGNLNISLEGGYIPDDTDSYAILSYATRTGDFATTNGLTFAGGQFTSVYSSTSLTLNGPPTDYWTGADYAAANNNWSDPLNWSKGAPPTTTQIARFDSSHPQNVSSLVDTNFTVAGLIIDGWTGGIDFGVGTTLTVNGDLVLASGSLGGQYGAVSVNGIDSQWTGGALRLGTGGFTNLGTLTLGGTSQLSLISQQTSGLNTLTNDGTIIQMQDLSLDGVIDNATGATYAIQGDANIIDGQPGTNATTINNAGTITKTTGTYTSTVGVVVDNTGTVLVSSGTLAIGNSLGNHIAAPELSNSGNLTIGPSSRVTVNGNYMQSSGGALNIEIAGHSDTGQFGTLNITSAPTLAGNLNVSLANGFVPAGTDNYPILSFVDSRSGDFATETGLSFSGGRFVPVYGSTNLTLNVALPAVLVVNSLADNTTDTSRLTLRDAITLVNNDGDPTSLGQSSMPAGWASQISGTFGSDDTIEFDPSLSGGTITLGGTALPTITTNVTISGPGASELAVSGNNQSQVFGVSNVTAAIAGLSIIDGNATFGGGLFSGGGATQLAISNTTFANDTAAYGGAIYTRDGTVTLNNDTFSGNTATGWSGAIDNWSNGTVNVNSGTFTGNSASDGGAIGNEWGTLTVTGATFQSNTASALGGAIASDGGLTVASSTFVDNSCTGGNGGAIETNYSGASNASPTTAISSSTFAGNQAESGGAIGSDLGTTTIADTTIVGNSGTAGGGGIEGSDVNILSSTITGNSAPDGGGIDAGSGLTLQNSIVSGNSAATAGADIYGGIATDNGYNLLGSSDISGVSGPADVFNTNPGLAALGNYGGPTRTMPPLPGSPAIGAGNNYGGPSTDQRGFARATGPGGDIGAVEDTRFIVNTTADTNDGNADGATVSLRDAITAANSAAGTSVIAFAPAVFNPTGGPYTITLTGGALPQITGSVQIDGPGANVLAISGNGENGALNIGTGATVGITGLTIEDGATSSVIANAGTLIVSGTTNFDLTFDNTGSVIIDPLCTLTVGGNYTQAAGATLDINIAGIPDNGDFGILAITGTPTLAGNLNIGLVNGFSPAMVGYYPMAYPIMSFAAGSRTTDFTNENGLTFTGGQFTPEYGNDNLTLVASASQAPAITSLGSATFTVGAAGTFTVTATGSPTPTITESGALPSGVSFTSATGILSGTPASGTAGSYPLVFTAQNGVGSNATQHFTLTVAATASALIFTTAPQMFTVGQTSGLITVVLEDGDGHVVEAGASGVTLGLGTTSSDGAFLTSGGSPLASLSLTIGPGSSTASFEYTDGSAGTPTVTVAATGFSANQRETVNPVTAPPTITSDSTAAFAVDQNGTFVVETAGLPLPALSETGALPSGVTFTDYGNGTATLAGTPASGTGAAYSFTITAANSTGTVTQGFTLTVDQPLAITSFSGTRFTVGSSGGFTVATSGYPTATFSESGTLPRGLSFTDIGNGSASISGTPAAGSAGNYPVTVSAKNGVGSSVSEGFTLTVGQPPLITSTNSASFTLGRVGRFTIDTTSQQTATLSESGTLPAGITFTDNHTGTATLSGIPGAGTAGSFPITIAATNSAGTTTQAFTLTVVYPLAITSADNTTFTVGIPGTFTIASAGVSPRSLAMAAGSVLPGGVTFAETSNSSGTGTLNGTPAAGSQGTYVLTFDVTSRSGISNSQTFALTVAPYQSPIARDATYTVVAGKTLSVSAPGVLGSDTDPAGAAMAARPVSGPQHSSTFTLASSGAFTYTPAANFAGQDDQFTYEAVDAAGTSNVATVTIAVILPPPVASFTWSMEPHFGQYDLTQNYNSTTGAITFTPAAVPGHNGGLIDYPWEDTNPSDPYLGYYLNNTMDTYASGWLVDFGSTSTNTVPGSKYTWSFVSASGGSAPATIVTDKPSVAGVSFRELGKYSVTLTVTLPDGQTAQTTPQTVNVQDYLIVSIGDSYSSGEGAPDVLGVYYQNDLETVTVTPAEWEDPRNDRSSRAWAAQAALQIQADNSHCSVTFISVAESGATIGNEEGAQGSASILYPSNGINPPTNAPQQPSEIEQLQDILKLCPGRPINALVLSAGGNDMKFDTVVQSLATPASSMTAIQTAFQTNLQQLPGLYAELNTALRTGFPKNAIQNIFISQYPDMTHGPNGQFAGFPGGLDLLGLGIGPTKAAFAYNQLLVPLNGFIAGAAQANGWNLIGGLEPLFLDDGIASGSASYFNSINQSIEVEGGISPLPTWLLVLAGQPSSGPQTHGEVHPNWEGYQAWAGLAPYWNGLAPGVVQYLQAGSIQGQVVLPSASENPAGLADWTVFLSQDGNDTFQPGDPTAVTNYQGQFVFSDVPLGEATVCLEMPPYTLDYAPAPAVKVNVVDALDGNVVNFNVSEWATTNPTFTVGTASTFTVLASGGPAPTLSLSGTLPTGVTLNQSNGTLSGTPASGTGGTYPLTFTANGGAGTNATQTLTLTVVQAPTFTSPPSATFTVGKAGSFTVTAIGVPTPTLDALGTTIAPGVTWAAPQAGSLVISGTPTTPGVYNIVIDAQNGIRASDPASAAARAAPDISRNPPPMPPPTPPPPPPPPPVQQVFTLTVLGPPTFTSPNQATFTVGSSGNFTVTAAGVPAPTITEQGTQPAGVNYYGNGVLIANLAANAGGSFPITFTATSGAATATQTFTIKEVVAFVNHGPIYFHSPGTNTFTVVTTGMPLPTLTGVTRDFGNGTGLIIDSFTTRLAGTFTVVVTARNSVATVTQTYVEIVTPLPSPVGGGGPGSQAVLAMGKTTTASGTPTAASAAVPLVSGSRPDVPTSSSLQGTGSGTGLANSSNANTAPFAAALAEWARAEQEKKALLAASSAVV